MTTPPPRLDPPQSGATAAEQLARALPAEALEKLLRVLQWIDHAGTTRVEIHHDRAGRVTDVDIAPATRRITIQRPKGA